MDTTVFRSKSGRKAASAGCAQAFVHLFWRFQIAWILLVASPAEGLTSHMHRVLASIPELPVSHFERLQDSLAKSLGVERVAVVLVGAMAGLALMLIAVALLVLGGNVAAQRTSALVRAISHKSTDPGFPCLNEDLTGSLGKLDELFVVGQNPRNVFLTSSSNPNSAIADGARTIAVRNGRNARLSP